MRFFLSLLCTALLGVFIFPTVYAEPLVSCTNIGFSDGSYTITGTTTQICAACTNKTVADVNGLTLSSGDAVLFKAGETFNIGTEGNRLNAKAGVLYGRYGTGNNPIITSLGVPFSIKFRGIVEINSDNNVTFDGIDVVGDVSDAIRHFSIWTSDADNTTISRLTVRDGSSGVAHTRATNTTIDKIVVTNVTGNPHETITFDNSDVFTISNSRFVNNGHAAMDLKGGSTFGEVFGSEFASTSSDPVFYMERNTDFHGHDNWIRDTVGQNKPLVSIGIEPLGAESTWHVQRMEFNNNVVENAAKVGIKFWMKLGVTNDPAVAEDRITDIEVHHNAIVNINTDNNSFNAAFSIVDLRSPLTNNADDWLRNSIHDNVIWGVGNANAIQIKDGVEGSFTNSFNLFQTGDTGSPTSAVLGTNAVFTSTEPFVDLANKDFDPAGPALGAGTGGGDIGAAISWTCGLGTTPPDPPDPPATPLTPLQTAKPDPYTINAAANSHPPHLWAFSDEAVSGIIEDEGDGTDCDLTLTGPDSASDSFGKYYSFIAANSDIAKNASCTPPVTTGVMCVLIRQNGAPLVADQTLLSFGEAADDAQINAINIVLGSGNPRAAIIPTTGLPGDLNIGPWSLTDNAVNLVCVRQSTTLNDIWMNGSGWQPTVGTWGGDTWTGEDQITIGAQGRLSVDQYVDGDVFLGFMFNSSKTDAEMDTLWNSGDPWAELGIDQTSGGEPLVPSGNVKVYEGASND